MTIKRFVSVQPRDPIIARDGRPFGLTSGNRMRCLDWPLPSVAAGSLRTLLGRKLGGNFDVKLIKQLKKLVCRGPLPVSGETLYVPCPNDAIIHQDGAGDKLQPCFDMEEGCGTDLPDGLVPVLGSQPLGKSKSPPKWWSKDKMVEWLVTDVDLAKFFHEETGFLKSPSQDERTHLKIDPHTLASEEGMLFTTSGLVLDRFGRSGDETTTAESSLSMTATHGAGSILQGAWKDFPSFQPFGGERRLVEFSNAPEQADLWNCPGEIRKALDGVKEGSRLRMVLASAAIFSGGWRPGWLDDSVQRIHTPPQLKPGTLKLKLVAVSNQRWEPVSGWSYEPHEHTRRPGPKAIRRMVPAGGVYFFEVVSCEANIPWEELWLASVSDDEQDRNDGFGLAMWGTWNEKKGLL